jgi:hypothetical protein
MRCRLGVTPFLPGGHCGNPLSTVLYVPGETLGPVRSGQQRRLNDVFLLEGVAWYGCFRVLGVWWAKDGGRSGCGSSSFCHFTIVVISFLFGHVFAVAPAFYWLRTIVSV